MWWSFIFRSRGNKGKWGVAEMRFRTRLVSRLWTKGNELLWWFGGILIVRNCILAYTPCSAPRGSVLLKVYIAVPIYCFSLNLHRCIYGLGEQGERNSGVSVRSETAVLLYAYNCAIHLIPNWYQLYTFGLNYTTCNRCLLWFDEEHIYILLPWNTCHVNPNTHTTGETDIKLTHNTIYIIVYNYYLSLSCRSLRFYRVLSVII